MNRQRLRIKKLTEKDCLLEIERVCRIICEQRIDETDLKLFRNFLECEIRRLDRIRSERNRLLEQREQNRKLQEKEQLKHRMQGVTW